MILKGLQKTTLIDYPTKVACTVFTPGCNFRCPFCHNGSLVVNTDLSETVNIDAFFDYLKKRKGILDGVCITGGEPLMQKGIEDFIAKIKELGYCVKVDTNGSQPQTLRGLIENGLVDYVAMDIKAPKTKYFDVCGIDSDDILANVCKSIELLLKKPVDFEFRTTVVRELHTIDDFYEIGAWIKGADKYFLQQFKDSSDLLVKGQFSAYDQTEMEEILKVVQKYIPNAQLRGI